MGAPSLSARARATPLLPKIKPRACTPASRSRSTSNFSRSASRAESVLDAFRIRVYSKTGSLSATSDTNTLKTVHLSACVRKGAYKCAQVVSVRTYLDRSWETCGRAGLGVAMHERAMQNFRARLDSGRLPGRAESPDGSERSVICHRCLVLTLFARLAS